MRRIILLFFLFPTLCFADTYYWVNGAGDWADLTHWATTSGGTAYHNTVPGSGDDVIFDGNSGSLDFTINELINSDRFFYRLSFSLTGLWHV